MLYACNGILFNHESPLRGETFVTRKITRALARIKLGLQDCLYLGNLDASATGVMRGTMSRRNGYVAAREAEDFVIATGLQYSVRDFVDAAAAELGIASLGCSGTEETGTDAKGQVIVRVDPRYFRPTEVESCWATHDRQKNPAGLRRLASPNWWRKWCVEDLQERGARRAGQEARLRRLRLHE